MMYCWISVGERQAIRFRMEYFKSLIKQEIGYFDSIQANEYSAKVATECFQIQQAVGEKTSVFIYTISMLLGALVISFISGWQIACIACAVMPVLCMSTYFYVWVNSSVIKKTEKVYIKAGGVSE